VVGIDNWDEPPRGQVRPAGPGSLEALGVRLIEGRTISRDDRPEGPGVAVVNETYVAQMLQGGPALGQQVTFSVAAIRDAGNPVAYQRLTEWEIVGVVEDAKYQSMAIAPTPDIYVPHTQINARRGLVAVRTEGREPTDVSGELRALVREVDPSVPVEFATMETLIADSLGTERLAMFLLLAFGLSAAALAAVGIYGVIALSVEGRVPEMAIRAALGAEPGQILWLAMSRGFLLGLVGIAAGAGVAVLGRRVLATQLYEVSATDPWVMVGAPLVLAVVAFLAVLVPALRTRRINLSTTLRAEN
jgi:putative ABC transport system permease protein